MVGVSNRAYSHRWPYIITIIIIVIIGEDLCHRIRPNRGWGEMENGFDREEMCQPTAPHTYAHHLSCRRICPFPSAGKLVLCMYGCC
uniref:Putative secreted protein n=1 Tax=Anopheles darlingi TaxID=43151 RepID=A0A2M4D329_ANODA